MLPQSFLDETYSRGATALLINRASGKGLIVDSTSANGPLLGNPFLTSTGWCKKYFFYVFSLFATEKRRESMGRWGASRAEDT